MSAALNLLYSVRKEHMKASASIAYVPEQNLDLRKVKVFIDLKLQLAMKLLTYLSVKDRDGLNRVSGWLFVLQNRYCIHSFSVLTSLFWHGAAALCRCRQPAL